MLRCVGAVRQAAHRAAGSACGAPWRAPCRRALHIAFFGTDDVSLPCLKALAENMAGGGPQPKAVTGITVFCPSDRPNARSRSGSAKHVHSMPVKEFAVHQGLPVEEVPYGL